MKKFKYIDALRGLAVIGVLLVHCAQYGANNYPPIVQSILDYGAQGVQLFFVASAFTLFLSLSNRSQIEDMMYSNFFIRRFFRIAPMFYLGIAYYLFQDGLGPRFWLGDAPKITGTNIASNLFFFSGFNPYWINSIVPGSWSIAVEVLFYCCVPFLFTRIKNLNQAVFFFLLAAVFRTLLLFVLRNKQLISDEELWKQYLYLYLPNQLPIFACGIILFFLVTTPRAEWHIKPYLLIAVSIAILTDLVLPVHVFFPGHFVFAIAFALLAYALSKKEYVILVNRLTTSIGKISYSLYLVHFAVLHWMAKINFVDFIQVKNTPSGLLNYGIRFLFLLAFSSIIATLCYRFIELPFQKLAGSIIKQRPVSTAS